MPLLALVVWLQVARAEPVRVVIVVNASQPITDISSADLRSIFLGQITRWPNHRAILPIVMPLDSTAGRLFLRHVIGMGEVDYAQNWIGVVFRGQAGSPPLVARSMAEAVRFVATHPEAIAVVTGIATDRNVRILTVGGASPDAIEYPLRW